MRALSFYARLVLFRPGFHPGLTRLTMELAEAHGLDDKRRLALLGEVPFVWMPRWRRARRSRHELLDWQLRYGGRLRTRAAQLAEEQEEDE